MAYDVMRFKLASSMMPELLRNSSRARVVSDAGRTHVPRWLLARCKACVLSCVTSSNSPKTGIVEEQRNRKPNHGANTSKGNGVAHRN